jgi:hypothetical protein
VTFGRLIAPDLAGAKNPVLIFEVVGREVFLSRARLSGRSYIVGIMMFKAVAIALSGLGAALALSSVLASAQTGTSSSWGSYGPGQQIPTQALTPFDRSWNHDHESQYEAEAGAEWLRQHSQAGQRSWFSVR